MVTTILSESTNKFAATGVDWREGVVLPPAGHVYGKTALTQQEWRRLHRRPGEFVTVVSYRDSWMKHVSSPTSLAEATGDLRWGIDGNDAVAYEPHTGYRLSVMALNDAGASR